MNNMQAKAILEKEKLWESNERVKTAFDKAIECIERLEKGVALIEEMAEELENCYGRETELTQKARDFINSN